MSSPTYKSLLTALIVAGIAAGCSRAKSPVVGTWRGEATQETVEFRSDGSLRGTDKYGRALTGSFELLDSDRLRMKMTTSSVDRQAGIKMVDNAEGVCRLKVDGELLTLTDEDGTVNHYRRTK